MRRLNVRRRTLARNSEVSIWKNFSPPRLKLKILNLYIGKVAQMTGASRKAIRLYESIGLIPAPRRQGRYRVYSQQEVFLIHMIKTAQSVGFNLSEMGEMIAAKVNHKVFPLKAANKLFDKKRATLRRQMATLLELEQRLVGLQEQMNRTFGG